MIHCSAMSVPGMRKFVFCRAPAVRDVRDTGSSWKSFTVLLNLQAHRINADRGGGTGFDRERVVYRTRGKVSGNVTDEPVTRRARSSQGFIHPLR